MYHDWTPAGIRHNSPIVRNNRDTSDMMSSPE
jgi:hypothetical protein